MTKFGLNRSEFCNLSPHNPSNSSSTSTAETTAPTASTRSTFTSMTNTFTMCVINHAFQPTQKIRKEEVTQEVAPFHVN